MILAHLSAAAASLAHLSTHTHQHVNLSLSQRAHASPHDADVANSGMERWVDAEAPVTQSLPNLITGSFAQPSRPMEVERRDRRAERGRSQLWRNAQSRRCSLPPRRSCYPCGL